MTLDASPADRRDRDRQLLALAVIYLIPERIATRSCWRGGSTGCPTTGSRTPSASNRYRATRNRVGMEWLFTPVLLSQNYHLVHHLHPSVPFHRYMQDVAAQRGGLPRARRGDHHGVRSATEPGRVPGVEGAQPQARAAAAGADADAVELASHAVFHRIPVTSVDPITADSALVTFDVPEELRDAFRFEPGQHVTVRTDLGGEGVRRNYSICAPATRGPAADRGQAHPRRRVLDLRGQRAQGRRRARADDPDRPVRHPAAIRWTRKHYVAWSAGSGITPILSILATTLEVETESRFTLIYGNRTKESTMFRARARPARVTLRRPAGDPARALRRAAAHRPSSAAGSTTRNSTGWLTHRLGPTTSTSGSSAVRSHSTTAARDTLIDARRRRRAHPPRAVPRLRQTHRSRRARRYGAATVTFTPVRAAADVRAGARRHDPRGALQVRDDAPYACMGGACGTCRAKLVDGTVEMDHNFALGKADLDAGYILTCQSHPTSPSRDHRLRRLNRAPVRHPRPTTDRARRRHQRPPCFARANTSIDPLRQLLLFAVTQHSVTLRAVDRRP